MLEVHKQKQRNYYHKRRLIDEWKKAVIAEKTQLGFTDWVGGIAEPSDFVVMNELCPRCGETFLHPQDAMNALSRTDNKTYICSPCGGQEAMEDYSGKGLLNQTWWKNTNPQK